MNESEEKAFREGYQAGYKNGEDDYSRCEFGGGSKPEDARKRDEDSALKDFQLEQSLAEPALRILSNS